MLSRSLFNIEFNNCILNASGCRCTSKRHLLDLDKSSSGGIISKTCSILERKGNEFPRYFETEHGSINSMGLPNKGASFYIDLVDSFNKPYIISVAANYLFVNFDILSELINKIGEKTCLVEINVSCPNIIGKEQLAYNFNELNSFLFKLSEFINEHDKQHRLIIGLKLPPYFDPAHFDFLATVITKHLDTISFLTAINSVGNGLVVDSDTECVVIKPKNGLGGIGGKYIKPIALANIWQLYRLFGVPYGITIFGCGGITSGEDVFEQLLCGASLCQVGSQLMREGVGCFDRIIEELKGLMNKKGYTSIGEFQGKLKVL
jgi:dihydroorotate dehydrogenase (fumarate)